MNNLKKAMLVAIVALFSVNAQAEYLFGFGNVSLNYTAWTSESENNGKDSQLFVELEGGAAFDWGEIYGFYDINNLEDSDKHGTFYKGNIRVDLGETGLHAFGQVKGGDGFSDQFAGIGKTFAGKDWVFKAALAGVYSSGSNEFNGGYLGITWFKNFQAFGENFTVSQWHDFSFARQSGKSINNMGTISAWWHMTKHFTYGLQYTYDFDEENSHGMINTIKYNF